MSNPASTPSPTSFWPVLLELLKSKYGPIVLVAGLMWGGWRYMVVPLNAENRIDWRAQQAIMDQQAAIAESMRATAATLERVTIRLEHVAEKVGQPGAFGGGGP